MKVFCDTNILIYAYSASDCDKSAVANRVIFAQPTFISTQVINEFISVCTKKLGLPTALLQSAITELKANFLVVSFSTTTQSYALTLKERYKLQYYDCLIIATALENGCDILYSEDMQHGLVIDNQLKIINPFLA